MSSRKVRFVRTQTPPFEVEVVVARRFASVQWAVAKAEAVLIERLESEFGIKTSLQHLKGHGVYTIKQDQETGHWIHTVSAPDGVPVTLVETVPYWWEASDELSVEAVPRGYAMIMATYDFLPIETWRKSSWPDRPHP